MADFVLGRSMELTRTRDRMPPVGLCTQSQGIAAPPELLWCGYWFPVPTE